MNDPAPKETPKGGHTKFSMPASGSQLAGSIPRILPHERVFPIQIGCELFKLSGASLSSDAPSYFSQYFQCQIKQAEEQRQDVTAAIRTLYIDRDPVTFKDISLHLQGYHIKPRDGQHFVRLFADAQFYTLPKLMSQLYEESIFVAIGGHEFQLDRDLFREPGNSPNFFSLGFAAFFTSPDQIFPGLERQNLIRPPSIVPPVVAQRSADVFREIMQLLRGYPVHIRDEAHRASLLRDCRYFNFKKVEQKLIPHNISYNQARRREEIVLRVEDILKSGISIFHEAFSITNLGARATTPSTSTPPITGPGPGSSLPNGSTSMNHHTNNNSNNHKLSNTPPDPHSGAWVHYARPYEDDKPYELVLEIGGESTKLHTSIMRAEFFGSVKARVAKLLEVVATKLNLPPTTQPLGLLMASGGASSQPATPGNTPLSEDLVRVIIEPDAHVLLDGKVFEGFRSWSNSSSSSSVTGPGTVATTTTAADVDEMTHAMSTSSPIGNATRGHPESSPVSSSAATFSNGVAAAGGHQPQQHHHPSRKRKRLDANSTWTAADGTAVPDEWVVRTGQWRLRIQSSRGGKSAVECVLVAVRLDACSSERARNAQRGFLRG